MAIPKEQLFQEVLHPDEETRAALSGMLMECLDRKIEQGVEEIECRMEIWMQRK